jgi:muconate cycloisomerase
MARPSIKIDGAEILTVELPTRVPYTWRSLKVPIGRFAILVLRTDTGLIGLGEAPAIMSWGGEFGRYSGEDPETVAHVLGKYVAPVLLGSDPFEARALLNRLDGIVRGHFYAKAMLESALLDIVGKALGAPVHQLLGGALRRRVAVCHSVGIAAPEAAADLARQVVGEGIGHLQVKVPGDPATDLAIVRAVRKAVGDDTVIYPDVNRGYRDPKTAIASAKAMQAEAAIAAIEQPVEGRDSMAQVTAGLDIPVIVDEGCWSPQDACEVVRHRTADIISIYFTKAGGLLRAMQIGAIAQAAGLPVNINGSLESGVGNAANLHACAALDGTVLPGVIAVTNLIGREQTKVGGVFYTDDIIAEPFRFRDGCLDVPDRPGLGVELDPNKIEKYCTARVAIGA